MLIFEILILIDTIFIIKWKLPGFCRIRSTNLFIFARNQHTVVVFILSFFLLIYMVYYEITDLIKCHLVMF